MRGVTKEVLSEVRLRANIVDIVAETVVLKRSGDGYLGKCPFHNEKTPSFRVSPERAIFKCFGCGESGDVFAFVQKIRGLNFPDAVRELANRYGVQLVESVEEQKEQDKRSLMRKLYDEACKYYQSLLKDPQEGFLAREYLKNRGIDEATIEKFKLGYAPNAWDGLINYLMRTMKVSSHFLAEAGLVREKQGGGSFYDLFRHRLMVPICDGEGRVIAFGGRTLGDDQVKYINSPETPIYKKGEHLYALHLAKESIKKSDSVIVVEGYFDAITPHHFGFTNCVATLGTAMTEAQARLIVRYSESKRVYLSFDSDDAGHKAVERGIETLQQIAEGIGIELRIIRIPGGKDPDECLRGPDGPELFRRAIETAPLIIDYQLEEAIKGVDVSSHTGRIEASRLVVPIIGRIKNALARDEYIRQCAMLLNLRNEQSLTDDVGQFRRENGLSRPDRSGGYMSSRSPFFRDGGSGSGGGFNRSGSGSSGGFNRQGSGSSWGGSARNDSRHGSSNRSDSNPGQFNRYSNDNGSSYAGGSSEEPAGSSTSNTRQRIRRGVENSRLVTAERQLLAFYLNTRDDYERVSAAMADWVLMTPEHQRIKLAIEGIGSQFNTMDDLQYQLMDRLAAEEDLNYPLTEIILKVEEIRKQNLPVGVVVKDCQAAILVERVTGLINELRQIVGKCNDDEQGTLVLGRIKELNLLNKVELVSAQTLEDLDGLKRKIETIESEYSLSN